MKQRSAKKVLTGQEDVPSRLIKDELTEDWVIISPRRSHRSMAPRAKPDDCCFCPPKLHEREILAHVGNGGRQIWVTTNEFPVLGTTPGDMYGHQEILIEGDNHDPFLDWSAQDLLELFSTYAKRMALAKQDPRIRFVLVFKNHGHDAGASQRHAHSQLWAMELLPPRLIHEREKREYIRAYQKNCPECLEWQHQEGGPLVVFEDQHAIAFVHPTGRFAYEVRLLIKRHVDNLALLDRHELRSLARGVTACFPLLKRLNASFNYYTSEVVQDPDQHCEIRLVPRIAGLAGMEIGSGIFINSVDPIAAAKDYREAQEN